MQGARVRQNREQTEPVQVLSSLSLNFQRGENLNLKKRGIRTMGSFKEPSKAELERQMEETRESLSQLCKR